MWRASALPRPIPRQILHGFRNLRQAMLRHDELAILVTDLAKRAVSLNNSSFHDLFDMYPDLTFWYGITPLELVQLPTVIKIKYLEKLPNLINQQLSMLITAAVYPYMDAEHRK